MGMTRGPRWLISSAPVVRRAQTDGEAAAPGVRRRFPGFQIGAALLLLWLAALSIEPLQTTVVGDERNIEQYATKRAQPTYPPLAQKQRIEGVVVVQVSVAGNGKVTNAEFVRGNNIFKAVSLEAAMRWEFKVPPEGVTGTIRFTFKLE